MDDVGYLEMIATFRSGLNKIAGSDVAGDMTQFITGHDLARLDATSGSVCPHPTGIANTGQICEEANSVGA